MILVNDIYKSVQGEGRLVGTPMVVLRLHGCTVGCSWCDTKQTWSLKHEASELEAALGENQNYANIGEARLADLCREIGGPNIKWVMLTGGEPCEQDLDTLIVNLRRQGFKVNLETSGTQPLPKNEPEWICVSPKYAFRKPLQNVLEDADEIKVVICTVKDLEENLDELKRLRDYGIIVSLQPVAGSKSALGVCISAATEYGFNLSIQMHKVIDIL